jgi:cytochrome c
MRIHILALLVATTLPVACSQNETAGQQSQDVIGSTLKAIALDSSEGAALTKRKCASCHSLDRNIRKIGPTLKGIIGRAPSIDGVPFETWTEEAIDKWIENPRSIKKKTRMALPGIKDAEERKAIIAYLKRL